MSFRELRSNDAAKFACMCVEIQAVKCAGFVEMLRQLGYPQNMSIDHFRRHDFYAMAHVLSWLIEQRELAAPIRHRIDPKSHIELQIATEQDRVIFVKTATQFLVEHLDIRVNPQKLYQANVYAVQEMLKVATFLYRAVDQMAELSISRALSTEITNAAVQVYDLLSDELEMREKRTAALARQVELNEVEAYLKLCLKAAQQEIEDLKAKLGGISSDESNLDTKIERKKADLDRLQKRLIQLQSVRPAFMDEYEKLESEFRMVYDQYVESFLNLAYLTAALGGKSGEPVTTVEVSPTNSKLNKQDSRPGQPVHDVERVPIGESNIEIWKEKRERPQILTSVPSTEVFEMESEAMGNDSSNEYEDDEDDELLLESEYQETNELPSKEVGAPIRASDQLNEDEEHGLSGLKDSPRLQSEETEESEHEFEII
ncbi:unnamed protein product [Soboliphyme baturini]|uniref:Clusterin-associated protein 1 n=1 Tax=Soboliphyme baturini TaxID=241478 RepID=A0A183ILL9_9BILA|nr:unnamed protein product [Soboliphyme baturini]